MPSAGEVVAFLIAIGELPEGFALSHPDVAIIRVEQDTSATPGSLSWVSPKNVARDAHRISRFRGSLLICPADVSSDTHPLDGEMLPCRSPKLAFIRVAGRFFAENHNEGWPGTGSIAIAPDANVGRNVRLATGVVIGRSVTIGDDVTIGPNTCIANTAIGDRVVIGANCSIGLAGFGYEKDGENRYWRFPHLGTVVIENDVEIGSNTCIDRGTMGATEIGPGTKIDNLVHVAHNVVIGANCLIIANSMIAGSTRIGAGTWVAPSVSVMNHLEVGENAVLGIGAVVLKPVDGGSVVVGNPAKPLNRAKDA